ncbi:unnamed protein product, partial [Didymodactylos carnosus]
METNVITNKSSILDIESRLSSLYSLHIHNDQTLFEFESIVNELIAHISQIESLTSSLADEITFILPCLLGICSVLYQKTQTKTFILQQNLHAHKEQVVRLIDTVKMIYNNVKQLLSSQQL